MWLCPPNTVVTCAIYCMQLLHAINCTCNHGLTKVTGVTDSALRRSDELAGLRRISQTMFRPHSKVASIHLLELTYSLRRISVTFEVIPIVV